MKGSRGTSVARVTRAADAALLLAVVAFVASTLPGVRSEPGFSGVLDGWLQGGANVLVALSALVRPLTDPRRRVFWSVVALALVLRACGFVLYLAHVRLVESAPYPSVADVAWLSSSAVFLLAAWLLAREHLPRRSRLLALDAMLGALAAGGLVLAVLYDPLVALRPPGTPTAAVATNLAYPLLDLAIMILVVSSLAATGWRPPPATALFAVGVTVSAVVDVAYLYLAATGSYRPGGWLAALTIVGAATIAWAGRFSEERDSVPRPEGTPPIVATTGLAVLCVVTLIYDTTAAVPAGAVLLSGAGIVLAITRGLLTLASDRQFADVVIAAKDQEIERFRALVEASDDFIAIATVDGRLVYLNPAGRRLVGLPDDLDVTTTTVADYAPELARAGLSSARPGLMEQGTWRGDSELIDHRGRPTIPVTVNTFVLRDPDTGGPWLMATVQRDISQLRAAQAALQNLADERKTLLRHLVEAQEAERAKIAADVHDDSVQALAAVDLQLGLLRRRLGETEADVLAALDQLRDTVRGATDRLRLLLFDLDSPAQRTDLRAALEEAAATLFDGTLRWQVVCEADVDLPEEQRVIAHRMAKEAMVNVGKHAHARTAQITVRRSGGGVEVEVADDGVGIEPGDLESRPGHRGLSDMSDRAAIAGGWVRVERCPGGGTRVLIWLPSSAEPG